MDCFSPVRIRRSSAKSGRGQIQVIFGPMFSGKSTELIRRLRRYQIARYECLIIKYAKDIRYNDDSVATHDKQQLKAVNAMELTELAQKAVDVDVIGIDEGQFFPDVIEFCETMANAGKVVIVAALDGTFQRQGFANILELVPLAEHVIKLTAVCMLCFEEGSYTKRISEDKEVEVIGGAEKYMAVCRRCFHSPNKVPASPRQPLAAARCRRSASSSSARSNGSGGVVGVNGCNGRAAAAGAGSGSSPPKKALFVGASASEEEKENGAP